MPLSGQFLTRTPSIKDTVFQAPPLLLKSYEGLIKMSDIVWDQKQEKINHLRTLKKLYRTQLIFQTFTKCYHPVSMV